MTTFTWVGGSGSSWNTASNWSGDVVPDSGDDVVIDTGTIDVDTATVNSITIGSLAVVDVSTDFVANTIYNSGSFVLITAATTDYFAFDNLYNSGLMASGEMYVGNSPVLAGNPGTFDNTGTIDITSDGIQNAVQLGVAPGFLALYNISIIENLGSISGEAISIIGTINNVDNTISIFPGGDLQLGQGGDVIGGTIVGGTLTSPAYNGLAGGEIIPILDGTTLSGMTINNNATGEAGSGIRTAQLILENGVAIGGDGVTNATTVNVTGGNLFIDDSHGGGTTTIDNAQVNIGLSKLTDESSTIDVAGQAYFGPNSSLNSSGRLNDILNIQGESGSLVASGTISNSAGLLIELSSFQNVGTIITNAGASTTFDAGSLSNTGMIKANGGFVEVATSVTGSGTILAENTGTVELSDSYDQQVFGFSGPGGDLKLDSPGGTTDVYGFGVGDTIDLTNTPNATVAVNGNMLIASASGEPVATFIMLNGNPALLVARPDVAGGTAITELACFARGTRISTPRGEVAVEKLQTGDLVVTRDGPVAAKWIGHRKIDSSRHPQPEKVWPVRVYAGAFGEEQPRRDLLLSPDHAVLTGGVLIPIRYLINGATIVQEPRDEITYFHVELDQHGVILAEGLACESFLDTGNRGAFANGGPAMQLYPDFAGWTWNTANIWEALGCARLVVTGPELKAARAELNERARELLRRHGEPAAPQPKSRNRPGSASIRRESRRSGVLRPDGPRRLGR